MHADARIVDTQKSVVPSYNGLRHQFDNFLRHNTHVFGVAPQVLETVDAETSSMLGNARYVFFEPPV